MKNKSVMKRFTEKTIELRKERRIYILLTILGAVATGLCAALASLYALLFDLPWSIGPATAIPTCIFTLICIKSIREIQGHMNFVEASGEANHLAQLQRQMDRMDHLDRGLMEEFFLLADHLNRDGAQTCAIIRDVLRKLLPRLETKLKANIGLEAVLRQSIQEGRAVPAQYSALNSEMAEMERDIKTIQPIVSNPWAYDLTRLHSLLGTRPAYHHQ